MTRSITEATKRFADATKEMRAATHELQHDLGETRKEIKKGVLELPEEARESADAMRRVVGDQIKALSELSEIINRHGKTLDISSPQLGEPRRGAARDRSRCSRLPRPSAPSRSRPGPSWRRRRTIESEPRPSLSEPGMAPVSSITASPLRSFETRRAEQRQWRRWTAGHPAGADAAQRAAADRLRHAAAADHDATAAGADRRARRRADGAAASRAAGSAASRLLSRRLPRRRRSAAGCPTSSAAPRATRR